jgi:hypothetical protein
MITKAKLLKLLNPHLKKLGFIEFKDSNLGFQGLFCKKIKNGLYLTLGLTIHRYYDNFFTGDYYLSKNTIIGATWGDIPNESYERIGFLLKDTERAIYPEDEINVKGTHDIWWNASEEKSVLDFLRVIELTEPRFINQPELLLKIRESQEVKILFTYSKEVREMVASNLLNETTEKKHGETPKIWLTAAEQVLKNNKEIVNTYTVKRLAMDAYRQKQLDDNI